MSKKKTEGLHTGEFLQSEGNGQISRVAAIVTGGPYEP